MPCCAGNNYLSEFYRISAEKFEFEIKFSTDLGGHPQTSSTPLFVITLRGRRALKSFLLLYESFDFELKYLGTDAVELDERFVFPTSKHALSDYLGLESVYRLYNS